MHAVHVQLPLGVKIEVMRWNEEGEGLYMNAKITMPAQPGQDGHCGNFNGNPADDDRMAVRSRLGVDGVPANEFILEGPKTPIVATGRPDLSNCEAVKLQAARTYCEGKSPNHMPEKSCLVDYCFG